MVVIEAMLCPANVTADVLSTTSWSIAVSSFCSAVYTSGPVSVPAGVRIDPVKVVPKVVADGRTPSTDRMSSPSPCKDLREALTVFPSKRVWAPPAAYDPKSMPVDPTSACSVPIWPVFVVTLAPIPASLLSASEIFLSVSSVTLSPPIRSTTACCRAAASAETAATRLAVSAAIAWLRAVTSPAMACCLALASSASACARAAVSAEIAAVFVVTLAPIPASLLSASEIFLSVSSVTLSPPIRSTTACCRAAASAETAATRLAVSAAIAWLRAVTSPAMACCLALASSASACARAAVSAEIAAVFVVTLALIPASLLSASEIFLSVSSVTLSPPIRSVSACCRAAASAETAATRLAVSAAIAWLRAVTSPAMACCLALASSASACARAAVSAEIAAVFVVTRPSRVMDPVPEMRSELPVPESPVRSTVPGVPSNWLRTQIRSWRSR